MSRDRALGYGTGGPAIRRGLSANFENAAVLLPDQSLDTGESLETPSPRLSDDKHSGCLALGKLGSNH